MGSQSDVVLAKSLNERRGEAFLVKREPYPTAKPSECHTNVEAYIRSHPGCQPVRGWVVEEFSDFTYFDAHSVVRLESGLLVDITPLNRDCPFITHTGTEEEFARLKDGCPRVQYPPVELGASCCSVPLEDDDCEVLE